MPGRIDIDEKTYESMLDFLLSSRNTDSTGTPTDTRFINEDFWLQDTAVIENIERHHGQWTIYLVFAHYLRPLKFIKRKIAQLPCRKKAGIVAHYMRRLAAKDQRGTLHVNSQLIKISIN